MFEILLPECKGVIPSIDLVTKDRIRVAFDFITTLADELSRRHSEGRFNEQGQPFSNDEYYQELGGEVISTNTYNLSAFTKINVIVSLFHVVHECLGFSWFDVYTETVFRWSNNCFSEILERGLSKDVAKSIFQPVFDKIPWASYTHGIFETLARS